MADPATARRFRPVHGLLLVAAFAAAVLGAEYFFEAGASRTFVRVAPDRTGQVTVEIGDLKPLQVRFFRFLNSGNQEVKFFIGRDETGAYLAAFDAAETDFKRKRGFRSDGAWIVNNKCGTATRLAEVNAGRGGCSPVPLRFRIEGSQAILAAADILEGWRYFR